MIVAPTNLEWFAIYIPLAAVLLVAMGIELRTGRIPNALAYPTCMYLVGARLAIGPAPFSQYLISMVILAVVLVGVGYSQGYLAAGAAKFGVAIAAALVPWMAAVVAGVCLVTGALLAAVNKIFGPISLTLPGSVVISTLTVGVIVLTVLKTSFQLF